jgi:hypothetical protein
MARDKNKYGELTAHLKRLIRNTLRRSVGLETLAFARLDQVVIVRNRRMITAKITIVRLPSTGFP